MKHILLLADANSATRTAVGHLLAHRGVSIVEADSEVAFKAATNKDRTLHAAIIDTSCDQWCRGLAPTRLVADLLGVHPKVKVLVTTARDPGLAQLMCEQNLGAHGWLWKPMANEELRKRFRDLGIMIQ